MMKIYNKIVMQGPTFAELELPRGLSVRVSIEDLPLVIDKKWTVWVGQTGHVYAMTRLDGKTIPMHRLLLNVPKGMQVDHVDNDGLNNTRENIRICTATENQANKTVERRNLLGVKGVSKSPAGNFRAVITPRGKQICLGTYSTPEEAAAAYKGAAILLWGKFAKDATPEIVQAPLYAEP